MKKIFELFKEKVKNIIKKKPIDNNIESRLDSRAKSCLSFLDEHPGWDAHRVDSDNLFLSGFLMFKGSKKTEKLTKRLLWLTWAIVFLTIVLVGFAYYEIPDYPLSGYSVTPISSQTYVDRGIDLVHDVDYLVKISKLSPSNNITIKMLTDVQGFYSIYDTRGYEFGMNLNSTNRTISIKNINNINPILLRVTYIERYLGHEFNMPVPVTIRPIPPSSNDSLYLFIRDTGYDIKYATKDYNLVRESNEIFKTDRYDSWKTQTIIIYENNVPIQKTTITPYGFATIEVRSLKIGESKTYLVKKL